MQIRAGFLPFALFVVGCSSAGIHHGGTGSGGSGGVDAGVGGNGNGGGGGAGSSGNAGSGGSGGSGGAGGSGGGTVCPPGLTCNVSCSSGGTTTISGKVYDPAVKNPIYNVSVYVPATPLVALPEGVPTGADACSCAALYQSGAVVVTSTAEDGSFTLKNAPTGSAVPLVIQIGKWRRQYTINVTSCQDNPHPDK